MKPTPIKDAALAMGAEINGASQDELVRGAVVDSRKVRGGELFFALQGTTDGAAFAPQAYGNGAVAVVSDRELEVPTLVVPDPLEALQELARWTISREQSFRPTTVGITGTVGKTTAKDSLAAILRTAGKKVCATEGNFNNEIGLPLTILSAAEQTEFLVLEMGATHPGDIANLCSIAPPDVGVLTAVSPVHLDSFGGLEELAATKGELAMALPDDGVFVSPVGVPDAATGRGRDFKRHITFAPDEEQSSDVWVSDLEEREDGLRFSLHADGEESEVSTPVFGTHLIEPLLAACGGALALGMSLEECVSGLKRIKRTGLRGEVYRLKNDILIYDDSYNASPAAMTAVLRYGANQASAQTRKLVAVLGGMFELGPGARAYHGETGEVADEVGVDLLACVGDEARWYAESFNGPVVFYEDAESAALGLQELLNGGEYVVVKGSRGVGLDHLTRKLRERLTLV
jgi:UDP-N-acetylmuramoyl-tripeptide--D-alanyl-D-alanine ligase